MSNSDKLNALNDFVFATINEYFQLGKVVEIKKSKDTEGFTTLMSKMIVPGDNKRSESGRLSANALSFGVNSVASAFSNALEGFIINTVNFNEGSKNIDAISPWNTESPDIVSDIKKTGIMKNINPDNIPDVVMLYPIKLLPYMISVDNELHNLLYGKEVCDLNLTLQGISLLNTMDKAIIFTEKYADIYANINLEECKPVQLPNGSVEFSYDITLKFMVNVLDTNYKIINNIYTK